MAELWQLSGLVTASLSFVNTYRVQLFTGNKHYGDVTYITDRVFMICLEYQYQGDRQMSDLLVCPFCKEQNLIFSAKGKLTLKTNSEGVAVFTCSNFHLFCIALPDATRRLGPAGFYEPKGWRELQNSARKEMDIDKLVQMVKDMNNLLTEWESLAGQYAPTDRTMDGSPESNALSCLSL